MARTGCSAFSPDNQLWANCGQDGKLKIWETRTGKLKQDYVPNLHLSSGCSVLEWITVSQQSNTVSHVLIFIFFISSVFTKNSIIYQSGKIILLITFKIIDEIHQNVL